MFEFDQNRIEKILKIFVQLCYIGKDYWFSLGLDYVDTVKPRILNSN